MNEKDSALLGPTDDREHIISSLYRGKEEEYRDPTKNMRVVHDQTEINGNEVTDAHT